MGKISEAQREHDDEQHRQALEDRLTAERETARRKADIAELKRLTSYEERKRSYLKVINDLTPLLSVPDIRPPVKPPSKAPKQSWVLVISDVHVGQKTDFKESGYLFEQSTDITRRQFDLLWETLAQLHAVASHGVKIERLVLLILGDVVEGTVLRASQLAHTDLAAAQQHVAATDMIAWFIAQTMTLCEQVVVRFVGGNHDRLTQKAGYAGLGEYAYIDTFSWLMGEQLRREFRDAIQQGRLDFENHESFFGGVIIEGQRIVYEHGASFRASTGSYGGIGYYGIANAARGYQSMLSGAEILCMGHWHRGMCLPMGRGWQILNGSFPPSTPYVQSGMKQYAVPQQVLFKLHKDHGMIGFEPIYLRLPDVHRDPEIFWQTVAQKQGLVFGGCSADTPHEETE